VRALVDTCVVSEIRRQAGAPQVLRAVEALGEDEAHLSVITLGELANGVALLAEGARKRELGAWLAGLERGYASRILGVDAEIARLWGELTAEARRSGQVIAAADGLIAATARRHGLTV
jgi:toxin FitB